jgi:hypothetical protein
MPPPFTLATKGFVLEMIDRFEVVTIERGVLPDGFPEFEIYRHEFTLAEGALYSLTVTDIEGDGIYFGGGTSLIV